MSEPINFGQLLQDSGGAFEPVPKGEYDLTVSSAEATKSTTDKVMFKVVYKIVGGPYNGRTIYNNITLTTDNPNALRMFFLNMKSMGLTEEFFAGNPTPSQVADALVGRPCRATIDHREWQGQTRENVKSLKAAVGIGAAGVAGQQVAPPVVQQPGVPSLPTNTTVAPPAVPVAQPVAAPPPPVQPAPVAVQPPVAAPVAEPPAVVVPEPPAAPAEQIPAGYEAIWATMPDAAKQAILASQAAPAAAPAPAAAAPSPGIVPPPPVVF